jgi:periplasmic divalent cation tolerance protein
MLLVVFVTVPAKKARSLAKILLSKRACACVNIVRGIESFFWWEEKIDACREALLVIKTKKGHFRRLEKEIRANHPYEVPEIIAWEADEVNKPYRDWVESQVHA